EIPHRWRDGGVARVETGFEGAKIAVDGLYLEESLGGGQVDHDDAVQPVFLLEGLELALEPGNLLAMGAGGDDVPAVHVLHIGAREDGRPRSKPLEVGLD